MYIVRCEFCRIYILWFGIPACYGWKFSCDFNGTLPSTKFHLDLFIFSDLKHVARLSDTHLISLPSCKDSMKTLELKFRAVCHKTEHCTSLTDYTMSCLYIGGLAQNNFGFYLHFYVHAHILFSIFRRKYDRLSVAPSHNTVVPSYPLIQYPRFQLYAVYRCPKKNWKFK
jgi:hypothetical protein